MAEFEGLNGFKVSGIDEQTRLVMQARDTFVKAYCSTNGWNASDLTIEQIMEIRSMEEWKNPTITA